MAHAWPCKTKLGFRVFEIWIWDFTPFEIDIWDSALFEIWISDFRNVDEIWIWISRHLKLGFGILGHLKLRFGDSTPSSYRALLSV